MFGAAQPYHAALYAYWATLPIWRAEHERGVAAVRAQLPEPLAARLWAEGEAMTLEQAYTYALARHYSDGAFLVWDLISPPLGAR